MRWNTFWGILCLSLLAVGTCQDDAENIEYKVSISGTSVELTCPLDSDENLKWEKNGQELPQKHDKHLVLQDFSEVEDSGYYVCYTPASNKNTYLYLKARGNSGSSQISLLKNPIISQLLLHSTPGSPGPHIQYFLKNRLHGVAWSCLVCEYCVEVDLTAVAIIIIVDICITLGLLMVIYYWSKNRKAKAKPVTRGTGAGSRPRGQNKERPPPVPNPDYEPIRKGQRDLYSGLNQRAV